MSCGYDCRGFRADVNDKSVDEKQSIIFFQMAALCAKKIVYRLAGLVLYNGRTVLN